MTLRRKLEVLTSTDIEMLMVKGKEYGDSWKKRGGVGAYMMLARKWDRIEKQTADYNYDIFKAVNEIPGLIDDLIDLGAYLLLVRSEGLDLEGSGNPYANIEAEDLVNALAKDPWNDMAEDHAGKKLFKIGDSELMDYYKVVFQLDMTNEEKQTFVLQLRTFYACKMSGDTPPKPLSALMASAKCVRSYRDTHSNAANHLDIFFPDRTKPRPKDVGAEPRLLLDAE